jgi:DNA-binding transcriptional LysR family regulator
MQLDPIAVFVKVVQAGSFTKAAQRLGMPNTTVSAQVAALERRLGVQLIQRTTRKLSITQSGEAFFRRCVRALEEIELAENEVTSSQQKPLGTLRLTAPVDMGHSFLPPLVQAYARKYSEIRVDLVLTNRVVDLVGEGVDLAIRAGELEDSTMIARRFVSAGLELFATPTYLKKRGTPTHPKDLASHELVRFSPLMEDRLALSDGKTEVEVQIQGRLSADDLGMVKIFALLHEGAAFLPTFAAEEEVARGKLVRLLTKWRFGSGHFSLVYPAQRFVSPKVQAFLDLAQEFAQRCQSIEAKKTID